MKKLIVITVIAVCLILCAAVWPHGAPDEEAIAVPPSPTVTATQPEALETPEIGWLIAPEKGKPETQYSEAAHDIITEAEPAPDTVPTAPDTRVIAEPEPVPEEVPTDSKAQPTPEPQSTPTPAPSQTVIDPQPGDMVYVPGFGWLESQGPGEVIHDESIYENGNKIGVMG